MKTHTLSILVINHPGVLSRISGLFSRRGYNIESVSVGIADENYSRLTVVTIGDDQIVEQIIKQLEKLPVVVKVILLNPNSTIYREMVLVKVSVTAEKRPEIVGIVDIFRASIIDLSSTTVTIEMTGQQSKIEAFIELMRPYGIKEIARTGSTALERGSSCIKDYINFEEE